MTHTRRILLTGLALAAGLAAPLAVHAQNLVTNPGFETGDFSGYTFSGDPEALNESYVTFFGNSGSYSAALTTSSADGFLTQSIATTAGQTYNISFFLEADGATPNAFSAAFGGSTLVSLTDLPAPGDFPTSNDFQQYTAVGTATGTATPLTFTFRDDAGYFYLDDISVTPVPAAVPEASSSVSLGLLFALGLGGMAIARKRKTASIFD